MRHVQFPGGPEKALNLAFFYQINGIHRSTSLGAYTGTYFTQNCFERKGAENVYLVSLVSLVDLVCLVCLVDLVGLGALVHLVCFVCLVCLVHVGAIHTKKLLNLGHRFYF